jgi:hypothetical protein
VQGKVVPDFASDFLRQTELPCQCVKLVGQRHAFTLQHELAFANHMHQFDAGQDRARRSKRFETEHRPRDTFDRAVILLDNVVEIFDLPNRDWNFTSRLGKQTGRCRGRGASSRHAVLSGPPCIVSLQQVRTHADAVRSVAHLRKRPLTALPQHGLDL